MLDKLKKFFEADTFAASLGISIGEAKEGRCVCTMQKREDLLNANNVVQGGALYTLGDFAFAVGAASTGRMAVSSSVTVNYVKPGKGDKFYAVATPVRLGGKIYTYDVEVFDGGVLVAKFLITGVVVGDMNL